MKVAEMASRSTSVGAASAKRNEENRSVEDLMSKAIAAELRLRGYEVEGLLIKKPHVSVYTARVLESWVPVEDNRSRTEVKLPEGITRHQVEGEGNCFFHALADQPQRARCVDGNGVVCGKLHVAIGRLLNRHTTLRCQISRFAKRQVELLKCASIVTNLHV